MSFAKGQYFERIAIRYLLRKGLKFLNSNMSFLEGEIDLIFSEKDNYLRFIEVKSVNINNKYSIYESLSKKKIKRLNRSISKYIDLNNLYENSWQLDFIGIQFDKGIYEIEFFENINMNLD